MKISEAVAASGILSGMSAAGMSRSKFVRAVIAYLVLWLPSLAVAGLIFLAALVAVWSAPTWSAVSFFLALPAVLLELKSFRASAGVAILLVVWDVVSTTWPHIQLSGFFSSLTDVLLLVVAVLTVLVAITSPFRSLVAFVQQIRGGARRAGAV